MDENESLLGVLMAIDQAVVDHPERREQVAAALPAYRDDRTPGWSKTLQDWIKQRSAVEPSVPPVDQALDTLARQQLSRSGPDPRVDPALIALGVAEPELFGPTGAGRDPVLASRSSTRATEAEESAARLVERGRTVSPTSASFWSAFVAVPTGFGRGGLDPDPASRLRTARLILGQTVANAEQLLQPTTWPHLQPRFWKAMDPIDGSDDGNDDVLADGMPHCFRERFQVTSSFMLQPVLQFVRRGLAAEPSARALEYRLCEHREHYRSDAEFQDRGGLTHDAGSIVNRQIETPPEVMTSGQLLVRTTKRVAFRGPFNGGALVMAAEALGYPQAFEAMVHAALRANEQSPDRMP
jgi:hypothetical protein